MPCLNLVSERIMLSRIWVVLALPVADALAMCARVTTMRPVAMRVTSHPTASLAADPFGSGTVATSAALAVAVPESFSGMISDFSSLSFESQVIVAVVYGIGLAAALQVVRVLFELVINLAKSALKTILQIGFVVALVEFFGIVPPP